MLLTDSNDHYAPEIVNGIEGKGKKSLTHSM